MQTKEEIQDLVEEFDASMQAGLDELAVQDMELAQEYFAEAGATLNQIEDKELVQKLAFKYTVDPRNFAY